MADGFGFHSKLENVGTVSHLAKSGRLLVSSKKYVEVGVELIDSSGKKIGRVAEVIGPVTAPYLSVIPQTGRISKLLGQPVFVKQSKEEEGKVK
jgi:RNA-binding protein